MAVLRPRPAPPSTRDVCIDGILASQRRKYARHGIYGETLSRMGLDSREQLSLHIESELRRMNADATLPNVWWENYGERWWFVALRPPGEFDLTQLSEQEKFTAWRNFAPMRVEEAQRLNPYYAQQVEHGAPMRKALDLWPRIEAAVAAGKSLRLTVAELRAVLETRSHGNITNDNEIRHSPSRNQGPDD